jgi:predicted nucleic acid-binding protein
VAGNEIVLDPSAAINAALVVDGFNGLAWAHLSAPTLLWSEVASGLSQLRWRGEITVDEAAAALTRFLAAPIDGVNSSELVLEATELARSLGWAKTYDAEYVSLSKRLDASFVTLDARLAATARAEVRVMTPSDAQRA